MCESPRKNIPVDIFRVFLFISFDLFGLLFSIINPNPNGFYSNINKTKKLFIQFYFLFKIIKNKAVTYVPNNNNNSKKKATKNRPTDILKITIIIIKKKKGLDNLTI